MYSAPNMALVHTIPTLLLGIAIFTYYNRITSASVCLNCTGVTKLDDCNYVEHCKHDQVCSIETQDSVTYSLGCRDAQECNAMKSGSACTACCNGKLCNTNGCGINGYMKSRGLICYDCTGVSDPKNCGRIQVCPTTEYACMLARTEYNGVLAYSSSCIPKQACASPSSVFGRRGLVNNESNCLSCCAIDLCNDKDCHSPPLTTTTTLPVHSVDGGWGPWSTWTRCSSSCGKIGIRHRFRQCDSPVSQTGGQDCTGHNFGTDLCHPPPCCTVPPRIYYISPDISVRLGDHVILRCNVTGAESLKWEGTKIVGHTFPKNVEVLPENNNLLISGVTLENIGLYHCTASNACGSTSRTVTVNRS